MAIGTMTAQQLAGLRQDGNRYELVGGELRMMSPAGGRHGRVAMNLGALLRSHVVERDLGVVYAAETGFLLSRNPDTVRAGDVAFVSHARLEGIEDDTGYLPLAPDLVGEVVSPSDSPGEVDQKAHAWIAAGTRLVLVVNSQARMVRVHKAAAPVVELGEDDALDPGDVVPGWHPRVGDFFA